MIRLEPLVLHIASALFSFPKPIQNDTFGALGAPCYLGSIFFTDSLLKTSQNDTFGGPGAQWATGLEFLTETYSK